MLSEEFPECKYRFSNDEQSYYCKILEDHSKADKSLCIIKLDACTECCKQKNPEKLNLVTASLLHGIARKTGNEELIEICTNRLRNIQNGNVNDATLINGNLILDKPTKLPNVRTRFLSAVKSLGTFITTGMELAPSNIKEQRLNICKSCEHFSSQSQCKLCGCYMNIKTHLPYEKCPIGKWNVLSNDNISDLNPLLNKWSVGVVAAPRNPSPLDKCLKSLTNAGFLNIRVFAEPDTEIKEYPIVGNIEIIQRQQKLGEWYNWYNALKYMYEIDQLNINESSKKSYFMMVQDDTLYCKNTRLFLDSDIKNFGKKFKLSQDQAYQELPRFEDIGVLSLYCAEHHDPYNEKETYVHKSEMDWMWGACAYIFPPESVRQILEYYKDFNNVGNDGTDWWVCDWANKSKRGLYFYYPSLVQHMSDFPSTFETHGGHRARMADSFLGEDFDLSLLLARS